VSSSIVQQHLRRKGTYNIASDQERNVKVLQIPHFRNSFFQETCIQRSTTINYWKIVWFM
jgi:hypothetical protein